MLSARAVSILDQAATIQSILNDLRAAAEKEDFALARSLLGRVLVYTTKMAAELNEEGGK